MTVFPNFQPVTLCSLYIKIVSINISSLQASLQQIPAYKKRERKAIAIVNPDTKAVINEDSLAPSTGGNSSHSTPTSSNRSTPVPQAVSDHSQVLVNKPSSHTAQLPQVSNQPTSGTCLDLSLSMSATCSECHSTSRFSSTVGCHTTF